jgi:hypothetical protein
LLLLAAPVPALAQTPAAPIGGAEQAVAAPQGVDPTVPAPALVTFAPVHGGMTYLVRITSSSGGVAECYTPCTLPLPPGRTHIEVRAPRTFAQDIELSGRASLIKVSHLSTWRYGVGASVLALGMAEFIVGAFYFPWNGGGTTTAASSAAAAWAFGAIELSSAIGLLAAGGKDRIELIDDPSRLKASSEQRGRVRFAGAGWFASPDRGGVSASFLF